GPAHTQVCDQFLRLYAQLGGRGRQPNGPGRVHEGSRVLPSDVLAQQRLHAFAVRLAGSRVYGGQIIERKGQELPWAIGAAELGRAVETVEVKPDTVGGISVIAPHP